MPEALAAFCVLLGLMTLLYIVALRTLADVDDE